MVFRPDYINAISPFIDRPLVKILAGIRRSGKSTIFEMLRQELLRRGIPAERIISRRHTEMDLADDLTAKAMYDDLRATIEGKGRCYLLLDELQEVDGWEKAVNSLLEGMRSRPCVTMRLFEYHIFNFVPCPYDVRISIIANTPNHPLDRLFIKISTE